MANGLNSEEYNRQREHIMKLQKSLIDSGQIPTCTNCEHWQKLTKINIEAGTKEVTNQCGKFDMIPPAEVIVIGCVYHMPTIPF